MPPPKDWLKCNIGFFWMKKKNRVGAAWVLRNDKGKTILHSRRTFSHAGTEDMAKVTVLEWAVESMKAHNISKVVLAFGDVQLVEALV